MKIDVAILVHELHKIAEFEARESLRKESDKASVKMHDKRSSIAMVLSSSLENFSVHSEADAARLLVNGINSSDFPL